ncbi:protein-export chaperone SecB [Microbaculum marinum]|uniref:Protein-export protein SecB n=1 Tax=Microbaculum marinum TaxID=1764581 RepID=A0AAW9S1A4_9HYPH
MTSDTTNGGGTPNGAQGAGTGGTQGGSQGGSQGGGPAAGPRTGAAPGPSVEIVAQYTKDLSFESPKAPGSLTGQKSAPPINFNIQVNAQPASDNDLEVELRLEARAGQGDEVIFNLELVYAGLFRLRNIPQEHLQPFVMIECPRLLFPFARQIVAETIAGGGFPPVMLGLIDFASLYQQRMAQQQQPTQTA